MGARENARGERPWPARLIAWGGRFALLILWLRFPPLARAQQTLVLIDQQQVYDLSSFLEILVDPGASLTLDDVRKPEHASRFVASSQRTPNFGFSRSAYWLRFRVRNEVFTRMPWVIRLAYPNIDFVDLFLVTSEGQVLPVMRSGRMRPMKSRDYADPNPVFFIPVPKSQAQTVYLRLQGEESIIAPLRLQSMTGFVSQLGIAHIGNGIFLGILAVMILYNLFLFTSLKDRNYLFFVLCISALLFFTVSERGIGARFLWPEAIWFNKFSLPLSLGLLVIALLKFADGFLMLKTRFPGLHRLGIGLAALSVGLIAAVPLFGYYALIRPIVLTAIIASVWVTGVAVSTLASGLRSARYLLLGFSFMTAGGISFLLVRLGVLPSTHITEMGFSFGSLALILLMALALADRIKMLKSEKEESEVHLLESEEQRRILSRAIEQSPVLIIITDPQGGIEYVNPRFTEVTGYSAEEARGKNPRFLKSGLTAAAVYRKMWNAITAGESWRGELRNRKKNGDLYWENALICPIKNEAGRITHYVGLMEDISEHKELQEQLFQVQKMDSIGTLAGGIAHDFNNILTIIKGHADVAQTKLAPGDPLAKNISAIAAASERAENLIRQILAFSRKQIYLPQVMSINRILAEMESMLARLIGEDIRVETSLAPDLPPILADPSQIERIFVNLVVNARDAINLKTDKAAEKKITVETGTALLDSDYARMHLGAMAGKHVFFSVSDTGTGIAEEHRQRIFEPFFTTKSNGTGLGLATVYGIVKQNQANIFLYSEVGKGSTFKIYWPASTERLALPEREPVKKGALQGREKVLLAEDDSEIADLAGRVLQEAGYQVQVAPDGHRALDRVLRDNFLPDLLITDVIMPGMNGKELADRIQAACPKVRVLYSSGYSDNHLIRDGQLDPRIDFLQKPYSAVDLLRKIREILDR